MTQRDRTVLDLISRHRFLRSDHVTHLVDGSAQHLVRRLGKLYHAGFVDRPRHQLRLPERPAPMVYSITERGRKELKENGVGVFPSAPRLRSASSALLLGHDLRVSDVLIALRGAARRHSLTFRLHHEWPEMSDQDDREHLHPLRWAVRTPGKKERELVRVIPDGAFSLHEDEDREAYFVLEVDRGTMPVDRSNPRQTSFGRKIDAYRETRQAGVLFKRWGVPGFRVLVVAETRARMHSLMRATSSRFRYGRSTMFLFAVAEDLLAAENPFAEPWVNCMGDPAVLLGQQDTDAEGRQSLPASHSC